MFPSNSINTTENYKIISTDNVNSIFAQKGYELRSTTFKKARKVENRPYAKHLLRYNVPTDIVDYKPEIVLINSYDGTNSFKLLLGVYRFACANGLIAGTGFEGVSVRHVGDTETKLASGIDKIVASVPSMVQDITRLSTIALSDASIQKAVQLVEASLEKRTDLSKQVDRPLRLADEPNTAWNVLNRLQECLIRGYYHAENDENKFVKARAVKSITKTIELNKLAWNVITEVA